MKTVNRKIGDFGENLACDFLERNGYRIIDRNFLSKYGEIDIICTKFSKKFNREEMFFVEVKTRNKNKKIFYPENAVNCFKKDRLQKTAEIYLNINCYKNVFYSFSCIAIIIDKKNKKVSIKFFERI